MISCWIWKCFKRGNMSNWNAPVTPAMPPTDDYLVVSTLLQDLTQFFICVPRQKNSFHSSKEEETTDTGKRHELLLSPPPLINNKLNDSSREPKIKQLYCFLDISEYHSCKRARNRKQSSTIKETTRKFMNLNSDYDVRLPSETSDGSIDMYCSW